MSDESQTEEFVPETRLQVWRSLPTAERKVLACGVLAALGLLGIVLAMLGVPTDVPVIVTSVIFAAVGVVGVEFYGAAGMSLTQPWMFAVEAGLALPGQLLTVSPEYLFDLGGRLIIAGAVWLMACGVVLFVESVRDPRSEVPS